MKLSEIAAALGCSLPSGNSDLDISAVSSPELAGPESLTFVADPSFEESVAQCVAPAVIVKTGRPIVGKVCLEVGDPYVGYARAARLFENLDPLWGRGVHQTAWVSLKATIDSSVCIGPQSAVGEGVSIGADTTIGACCVIEPGVRIGERCRIDSGVIVRRNCVVGSGVIIETGAVIGSEGFANARDRDGWVRIPSFGNVIVEDDVWIGANTCIDRGSFGSTRVGKGVRLDNLIHLAHNVQVGESTAMAAQVGISGSTRVGKRAIIAGQAGFVGHISIGDDSFVGAQAGVSKDVPAQTKVTGYPAREFMKMRRIDASLSELPQLLKEVKRLRSEIEELKKERSTPPA